MKKIVKLAWWGQGLFAITCFIGSIWSGYMVVRMLSHTGEFWQIVNQVYGPSWFSLLLLLIVGISSFFRWWPSIALNLLTSYTTIHDLMLYFSTYKANHTAHLDGYGSIPITFGHFDYSNEVEVFSGLLMLACGIMLFFNFLRNHYKK